MLIFPWLGPLTRDLRGGWTYLGAARLTHGPLRGNPVNRTFEAGNCESSGARSWAEGPLEAPNPRSFHRKVTFCPRRPGGQSATMVGHRRFSWIRSGHLHCEKDDDKCQKRSI